MTAHTDSNPSGPVDHTWFSQAALDVTAERRRQVEEGWTPDHDDEHDFGELARAAACYADPRPAMPNDPRVKVPTHWPWDAKWWKPKDRRSDLVRAGALILAEIERLDRGSAGHAGVRDINEARRQAGRAVMDGIVAGRQAFRDGRAREDMADESHRIGWDEAQHDAGVPTTEGDKR